MKLKTSLLVTFIMIVAVSCTTTKNAAEDKLYGQTWELEYISGPRIAFQGLYPDEKPSLTFDKKTQTVMGTDSCNGYSAPFTLDDTKLSFGEAGPATLRYCGEGDVQFKKMINSVNKYMIGTDGKLNLMIDGVSVMKFRKK